MCDLSRPWELEWQKARENRSQELGVGVLCCWVIYN